MNNIICAQALSVRLGPAERAAGAMVPRLRELLLGARVLCRALGPASPPAPGAGPAAAPHVELFVRTGPQHILASVNNAIVMEYDYLQQYVNFLCNFLATRARCRGTRLIASLSWIY